MPLEYYLTQYGPWGALAVYILLKDVVPFAFNKWLPDNIRNRADARRDILEDRSWARDMENERLETLKKIAEATQTLSSSMVQTNERVATVMTNQLRMLEKEDMHHTAMMEAVGDMRALTKIPSKKARAK